MESLRSRRYYLDSDVLAAAVLEPAAMAHLLAIKRHSIVRISATVIHEVAAAPRDTRHRLLRAAFDVCHCFTIDQAPEVLAAAYELPESQEMPSPEVVPIRELTRLLGLDPPEIQAFFATGGFKNTEMKNVLPEIDRLYKGADRKKLGTFEDYIKANTIEYLRHLSVTAVKRGHMAQSVADLVKDLDAMKRLLTRKPLFFLILMMQANVYRTITKQSLKGEGSLSDLRTVIETADGDVFVTRDKELAACAKLVSDTITDVPRRVELLPDF